MDDIICPKCKMKFNTQEALCYHLNRQQKCDECVCLTCNKIFICSLDLELHKVTNGCLHDNEKRYGVYTKSKLYEHMNIYSRENILGFMQCKVPHGKETIHGCNTSVATYISPKLIDIVPDMKLGGSATAHFTNCKRDREIIIEIMLDNGYFTETQSSFNECVEMEMNFLKGSCEVMKVICSYEKESDVMTCIFIPVHSSSRKFLESPITGRRLCSWM